jgi:hypothetical protein
MEHARPAGRSCPFGVLPCRNRCILGKIDGVGGHADQVLVKRVLRRGFGPLFSTFWQDDCTHQRAMMWRRSRTSKPSACLLPALRPSGRHPTTWRGAEHCCELEDRGPSVPIFKGEKRHIFSSYSNASALFQGKSVHLLSLLIRHPYHLRAFDYAAQCIVQPAPGVPRTMGSGSGPVCLQGCTCRKGFTPKSSPATGSLERIHSSA